MFTFTVSIETGNAAFAEDAGHEIGRILGGLAAVVSAVEPGDTGSLLDLNGNRVGAWRWAADVDQVEALAELLDRVGGRVVAERAARADAPAPTPTLIAQRLVETGRVQVTG